MRQLAHATAIRLLLLVQDPPPSSMQTRVLVNLTIVQQYVRQSLRLLTTTKPPLLAIVTKMLHLSL